MCLILDSPLSTKSGEPHLALIPAAIFHFQALTRFIWAVSLCQDVVSLVVLMSLQLVIPWGVAHMPGISEEIQKDGFRLTSTQEYSIIKFRTVWKHLSAPP